jgi:hypothetical protein
LLYRSLLAVWPLKRNTKKSDAYYMIRKRYEEGCQMVEVVKNDDTAKQTVVFPFWWIIILAVIIILPIFLIFLIF